MMISTRRLVEMAARGRKRISFVVLQKSNGRRKAVAVAQKGHFVAYAADGKRYMLPLAYLLRPIFQELLRIAEEEFGLNNDGAIKLPCDSQTMDFIMPLLCKDMNGQMENAVMISLISSRCLSSSDLPQSHPCQHMPLQGF